MSASKNLMAPRSSSRRKCSSRICYEEWRQFVTKNVSKLKIDMALRSGSLRDVLVEFVLRTIKQELKLHELEN